MRLTTRQLKQIIREAIEDEVVPADFKSSRPGPKIFQYGNGITKEIQLSGDEVWRKNGKIHRDEDLPAIIHSDGTQAWYKMGKRHRDGDKPAIVAQKGRYKAWFKNGKRHRDDDKPAETYPTGNVWYKNGELHREGEPAVVNADGTKKWYLNGKLIKKV